MVVMNDNFALRDQVVLITGGARRVGAEIARALTISEYTAQGYLKSLLSKTGSRNRAAMVAKVLNWNKDGESAARVDEAAARDPEAVGVL